MPCVLATQQIGVADITVRATKALVLVASGASSGHEASAQGCLPAARQACAPGQDARWPRRARCERTMTVRSSPARRVSSARGTSARASARVSPRALARAPPRLSPLELRGTIRAQPFRSFATPSTCSATSASASGMTLSSPSRTSLTGSGGGSSGKRRAKSWGASHEPRGRGHADIASGRRRSLPLFS